LVKNKQLVQDVIRRAQQGDLSAVLYLATSKNKTLAEARERLKNFPVLYDSRKEKLKRVVNE